MYVRVYLRMDVRMYVVCVYTHIHTYTWPPVKLLTLRTAASAFASGIPAVAAMRAAVPAAMMSACAPPAASTGPSRILEICVCESVWCVRAFQFRL